MLDINLELFLSRSRYQQTGQGCCQSGAVCAGGIGLHVFPNTLGLHVFQNTPLARLQLMSVNVILPVTGS